MKKFVVHVMYDVAKASPGGPTPEAMARGWGPGHRFSLWHDNRLAVQAEVRAGSPADAIALVDAKVQALWAHRPGGAITLTLSRASRERVLVGARRRLRRGVQGVSPQQALGRLQSRWGPDGRRIDLGRSAGGWTGDGWTGEGPDGDGRDGDGGGTAGVREPRRPRTPPGDLYAAAELPGPPAR